jgi:fluoroquinolone transport system permease protein
MSRLLATMKLDVTIQWRNRLYAIGIGLSLMLALALGQFVSREALPQTLPLLFLFAVSGTTMLYVAGLLIFEKDDRTLEAIVVTPIHLSEYIGSKMITLTFLALLESLVVLALAYGFSDYTILPLIAGIVLMGMMLTLMGFVMIVRYNTITDFLVPVVAVNLVLQLPALYFTGTSDSLLWLILPTTAPTMLMWSAWHPIETWQLIYAVVYSVIIIAVLYRWALIAFNKHIILKEGK